jgi:hypothetical protein
MLPLVGLEISALNNSCQKWNKSGEKKVVRFALTKHTHIYPELSP